MDRLDIASAVIVVSLGAFATWLSVDSGEERPADRVAARRVTRTASIETSARLVSEESRIRRVLETGRVEEASVQARQLADQFPNEGLPFMLLGDVQLRRQALFEAIVAYRDAVDRNPDYLDKKTAIFQGKKLRHLVEEAIAELEKAPPSDESERRRKVVHYLQRRIAGSCG